MLRHFIPGYVAGGSFTSLWLLRSTVRMSASHPKATESLRSSEMTLSARFCCKSLFALAIKISFGRTGDFHVNMWGTSSSEEKLAGDPGDVIEATRSAVVGRIFLQQEN